MHLHFVVISFLLGGDFDEKYVLSSRVRTGRSIKQHALPPHCTRAERKSVENILANALNSLEGKIYFNFFCLLWLGLLISFIYLLDVHIYIFLSYSGDLSGTYYPLNGMTEEEQNQLIDDHFLFDKPVSPLLTCAGMARDWPEARGTFVYLFYLLNFISLIYYYYYLQH